MKLLRVHLRGWTASFRYPGLSVAVHPTLPIPPLSTLYGLISAAKGEAVTPTDCAIGFIFQSSGEAVDLELTYELSGILSAGTNVVKRHLLYEPELWLYLSDLSLFDSFRRPHYPLLLGRSTELVQVLDVQEVELEMRANARVGKTLIPFPQFGLSGVLQALPTHFTMDIPRKAVGVRPWMLVNDWQAIEQELPFDSQHNWAVWIHTASA